MKPKFTALTVLSEETDQYFRLVQSARKWGWPFKAFFKPAIQGYEAFMQYKHLYIYAALVKLRNEGVEQFLFLDGWDTVFTGKPPLAVLNAKKLHFSAENNCFPEPRYEQLYPDRKVWTTVNGREVHDTFRFLNAGVIWGPVSEYMRLCPTEAGFDQLQWERIRSMNPDDFVLDVNGEVAVTLQGITDEHFSRFSDGLQFHPPEGIATWPVVLHANGKWRMPPWAGL
jgi:hypothetical protein